MASSLYSEITSSSLKPCPLSHQELKAEINRSAPGLGKQYQKLRKQFLTGGIDRRYDKHEATIELTKIADARGEIKPKKPPKRVNGFRGGHKFNCKTCFHRITGNCLQLADDMICEYWYDPNSTKVGLAYQKKTKPLTKKERRKQPTDELWAKHLTKC